MIQNLDTNIFSYNMDFEVREVHKTSLRILDEIGIFIGSNKCLELLSSIGCNVDFDSKKVKIPEPIVKKAISSNHSAFKLYDRNAENSINIGEDNLVFTTGAASVRIKEFDGSYRSPTLADLSKMTKIQDYFDSIDIMHTIIDPMDISPKVLRTQMAAAVLKNTTKPCSFVASDARVVEDIYKMGVAIRGSKESLVEKPLFTIGASSEAVLGIQEKECEVLMRCAELGIPTGIDHYPIMGMTAPVSISGALALANANYLCGLIIEKAIDPENPSDYPVMAGSFDMKSANVVTSSPEIWLYYLMGIKLGKFYNLPTRVLVATDSKSSDLQMAYEKSMGYLISASAGVNNIFGATCEMDAMNLASYEQIVIDSEIISSISHFFDNPNSEASSTDFDIIKESYHDKMYFLAHDHTLKNYKKVLWSSNVFIRDNFLNWKRVGMPTVIGLAHKKVKKILKDHRVPSLGSEVVREIDKIVLDAEKRK